MEYNTLDLYDKNGKLLTKQEDIYIKVVNKIFIIFFYYFFKTYFIVYVR